MLWCPDEGDPQLGRVYRAAETWPTFDEDNHKNWNGTLSEGQIYVYMGRSSNHARIFLPDGRLAYIWYSAVYEDEEM